MLVSLLRRWTGVLAAILLATANLSSVAAPPPPAGLCAGVWLGVALEPAPTSDGARIAHVESPGPAADAGLAAGDVVVAVAGQAIRSPADVAHWAADTQPGDTVMLSILRQAAVRNVELSLWGVPRAACLVRFGEHYLAYGDVVSAAQHFRAALAEHPGHITARQGLEAATAQPSWPAATPAPSAVRADGMRAKVAVGGFDIKAAKAVGAIGDGLRDMVVSALHQNGYFIVVERDDLRGILAEQDLARSPLARPGRAFDPALEAADIMVFGAITEFEPQAGGSSFMTPMMGAPIAMGARITWAQMALDVRVVDVRTGRVLGAERIPGMARFAQATIAGAIPVGGLAIPTSLSVYRNTPMEFAIRDCIRKVGYFVINSIGDEYYRHR